MLNRPRNRDVRRLSEIRAPWCVTVYGRAADWTRGHHPTAEVEAQIRAVCTDLDRLGAPAGVVDAIRARLDAFARDAAEERHPLDPHARSVAVFATETELESYVLTSSPQPWTGVGDRFLIGPLLEGALGLHPPVVVLALSESEVRLIDVSARPIAVLDVPDLPRDLHDALDLDLTHDRQTLAHARTAVDPKTRLRQYARLVDDAVGRVLPKDGPLLVLAAAEPLAGIFRSVTDYPVVAEVGIPGNHDGDSPYELADLAVAAIEHHRRTGVEAHLARYAELPARGHVVADLHDTADRARAGAVDTLFVDVDRRVPIDAETSFGPATIDLVDEIVRAALASGATVVPVRPEDLPTTDPVAAVLRYDSRQAVGGVRTG